MTEQGKEPSIDPQPGEIGDGQVDVAGGTEQVGTPSNAPSSTGRRARAWASTR
jgi:hypothetical protein